ncbi:MAG: signal peptide peptidase SppA [Candidatus Binatia bacterium]
MRKRTRYILILLVLVAGGVMIARRALRGPVVPTGSYLILDVSGRYVEAPPQDILGRLLRRSERTLIDLLTTIREAHVDKRIKGVIIRISRLEIGWAKAQDVRDALLDFKKSGKPLLALLEHEVSGGNKEYYLASAADRVYLSPDVTAPLTGLVAEFYFLGGVWDKLDIQMDVEKIAEYKTMGDMIANKEMTSAHREMADSLLDSINEQFISALARSRGIEPATVVTLVDQAPVSPSDIEAAHLSDGTKFLQDIHDELGGDEAPLVLMKDYAQVDPKTLGLDTGPKIAVVYAVGTVTTGESSTTVQGQTVGSETVSQALKDAADDTDVRAIIFRIDSPGGSALASDLVWRATQDARKKKPVIVSMSDVAGSGGYYIAAGASRIVAQPGTMTGSIGVVMARPNIRGLLGRLGINTQTLSRGKFADLEDITTPLTADGRQKLVAEMNYIYDVFVNRVSVGRNMTPERVNEIGRGRVWTGAQAKGNGLVDELGGFAAAIQAAKQAAGIEATQEAELAFYPQPRTFIERISELLSTHVTVDLPPPWQRVLHALVPPFEGGSLLALARETVDIR